MEKELNPYELPETTFEEVVDKIKAYTSEIRMDWTDPRNGCKSILRLCDILLTFKSE